MVDLVHELLVLVVQRASRCEGLVVDVRILEHSRWVLEAPLFENGIARYLLDSILVCSDGSLEHLLLGLQA